MKRRKITISENDKQIIKQYTSDEFYNKYIDKDITYNEFVEFQMQLDDYIFGLLDKYYNTKKESRELQRVYDNIYNDN